VGSKIALDRPQVDGPRSQGMRVLLCVAAWPLLVDGFYLPGVAPREYLEGEPVELKVNTLTSVKTQLPYGYYTLPYCKPAEIKERVENLGEILGGDAIENSPYDLKMRQNATCQVLCKKKLTKISKNLLRRRIDRDYTVNWIVDNLPAATKYVRQEGDSSEFVYMNGFPVGLVQQNKYYLHNHVRITLSYHANPSSYVGYRIVGFEVEPRSLMQSVRDEGDGDVTATCHASTEATDQFEVDAHDEVWYTYDIFWAESDIRWASRWDNYLKMEGGQIHWLSILNSVMIVLFLSGLVAMILLRTLHRDIVKYNDLATKEEIEEETGWKLVHGDVFRKPHNSMVMVATVGCGVQLLGMAMVTMFFGALGFLSPAHRGGLLQSTLLLFTFMGALAGYSSARLYKLFQGDNWKEASWLTALLFPGAVFGIFFFLNLLIWGQKSAGAVPFVTMFSLLILWFGISVPLVFLGAYMGFRQPAIELPVRTNQMPREIPLQPWYMKPIVMAALGGILPFGAVFTELFFIMSSIWQHQIYYMFGILVLVLLILIITCAEISMVLTYFQLTSEDYHWWWRSFFTSGFSGVYVFAYSWLYFNQRLQIEKVVSIILYFGYMFIISGLFVVLTGTIGVLSTFAFVKTIYGSIKVD
jgi:transmembrane 9 superfamily protein 2/4